MGDTGREQPEMRADIVVPNYNGCRHMELLARSLAAQDDRGFRVILVDNGSEDGSPELFEKLSTELGLDFVVVRNGANLGFPAAVNAGIRISRTEIVILLNNDIEADPSFVRELKKCIESKPEAFSVQSRMMRFDDRDKLDDAGDGYTILGWGYKTGDGKKAANYPNEREIFSSCAGAAAYRKSVFDKIGLFDESFFAYLEDMDISWRAKIAGYTNHFCPDSVVYHVGSSSTGGRRSSFKMKLVPRNNIWLVWKNMPLVFLVLNFPFIAAGILIKGVAFALMGFGREYWGSVGKGLKTLAEVRRGPFRLKDTGRHIGIQLELIAGVWNLIRK